MNQLTIPRMHGLGNTMLLVDADRLAGHDVAMVARRWCALAEVDALLLHDRSPRLLIRNADGSEAELCGNGLRCLARLGVDEGWYASPVRIQSPAGVHEALVQEHGTVRVSLPAPRFGSRVVRAYPSALQGQDTEDDACITLEVDGHRLDLHLVSTGNPHAVIPCGDAAALEVIELIGPVLETHPAFPAGINVHLVYVADRERIQLRSWERGVGPTRACATGATAAMAAMVRIDLVDDRVEVEMPGGVLEVQWEEDDSTIWNTGPAEYMDPVTVELGEDTRCDDAADLD